MVSFERFRLIGRIVLIMLVAAAMGTVGKSVQEVAAFSGKCYDTVCNDDDKCQTIECDVCHIDNRCAKDPLN